MKKLRQELSEDVFIEILLRIPAPDVLRFRVVSKLHRTVIDSPNFIRQHYHLSLKRMMECPTYVLSWMDYWNDKHRCYWVDIEAGLNENYVAKLDRPLYAAGHPPSEFHNCRLLGSCMGILFFTCETTCNKHRMLFWNPTTRRHRKVIPKLNQDHSVYNVGYDSVADDMKLLQKLNYYDMMRTEQYYVYSCRTESWKQIQGFNNQWPDLILQNGFISGVFVEGTNCTHVRGSDSGLFRILAFDFSTERFGLVPLPNNSDLVPYSVASLSGCLCLYNPGTTGPFELWMMKEYGVEESWAKMFSFNTSPATIHLTPIGLMNNGRQLLLWCIVRAKEKLIVSTTREFFIYDDDDKSLKSVTCEGFQFPHIPRHFLFTPSIRLP